MAPRGKADRRTRRQAGGEASPARSQRKAPRGDGRTGRRLRRLMVWGPWAGAALGLVILVGLFAFSQALGKPGEVVALQGNDHISSPSAPHVPYNTRPPTSGPHTEGKAPWGVHSSPIADEVQIHNLEDGGVAVQYRCSDCPELVEKLKALVTRYPDQVILAPYPNMDTIIALTAWGRIERLEAFDEARVVKFIEAYRGIDHHLRRAGSF